MTASVNKKSNFQELYKITDGLMGLYEKETSPVKRDGIIRELLEVTEKLVKKNCRAVINRENGITEYTEEELYSEAIGYPLNRAIQTWDSSTGVYFMKWWFTQYIGHFKSLQKKQMTKKNSVNKNVLSLDKQDTNSEGSVNCLGDHISDRSATEKLMQVEDQESAGEFMDLLTEFEQVSSRGWTIRAELLGEYDLSSSANRKRLSLAKKQFKEFLLTKGTVKESWFTGRSKQKRKKDLI